MPRWKYIFICRIKIFNIYRCMKIWFDFLNREKLTQWRHWLHSAHKWSIYFGFSCALAGTYTCMFSLYFVRIFQNSASVVGPDAMCIGAANADDCSSEILCNVKEYGSQLVAICAKHIEMNDVWMYELLQLSSHRTTGDIVDSKDCEWIQIRIRCHFLVVGRGKLENIMISANTSGH